VSLSFFLVVALALSQPAVPSAVALAREGLPSVALAQEGPFKIVVLAGEDSVNVIQQKTAVAPLVEVRDRNNNPVSGAVVTFAIQGGKAAAFQGGAATITVTTGAAGQAAAAGLTPLATGAVNISVSAAVQGQVVTAAITQVNVMTAAEAAAAASASGAGAGAGGGAGGGSGAAAGGGAAGGTGGGLSATTIAIVGGAVAAGAVAATQVVGGSGDAYQGTFSMNGTVNFATCFRTDHYAGTLVLELESTSGSVSGHGEIKEDTTVGEIAATNCPGISPGPMGDGKWGMPDGPVTGTESNIVFESHDNVQSLAPGIRLDRTFKFTGALSGSTITGKVEMAWIPQPGGLFVPMTSPITLTKQ
jgi:hypothetical protein